jgi:hypothetical protein
VADETTEQEVQPAEVTEDDLRNLIGEVLDEKLATLSEGVSGLADSIFDKLKEEVDNDGLLNRIGSMIDEKLKGVSSGGNGGSGNGEAPKARVPKIRIFS